MKNLTLIKIASLFIFLLSAQLSFGQNCSDWPNYSSSATYVDGDQVHYQGKIWENRYGNNVVPSGGYPNNDYVNCSLGGANWCFVTTCVNCSTVGGSTSSNATVCSGSNSGTITLSGHNGSIVRWEKSTNNWSTTTWFNNTTTTHPYSNITSTTQYRAVVKDGSCSQLNSSATTITVNSAPTASFSASATAVDTTQTITFTNSSSNATSYSWNFGDSTTSSATSPSHQYASAGTYTVTLTATNSCGNNTATTSITVTNVPITLFFEDFEDEVDGATTGTAQGAVNWSSSASNSNEVNYIGVYTYEGDKEFYIEMKKDDEYANWTTDAIDISDYEDVNFSLDVGEYGDIDSDHYIKTEYSTNNGSTWNTATVNGYLNDDLVDGVDNQVSQDGINANSLKIRIKVVNKDDEHFFDDILVQGQLKLPGCATNLAPTDTATNVSVTPTLSWEAVSGATGYKVFYGTDSTTTTALAETASTSVTLPTLPEGTLHYWKVVPTNARGDATGCGNAISFTTIVAAPGCATGLTPTNGTTDVSLTPTLSWTQASSATSYKVYLDTGSNPTTLIYTGSGTSAPAPTLSYGQTYYWKVVPINAGGSATGCSAISFTTIQDPAGSAFITGGLITVSKNAYLYLEKNFTNSGGSITLNSSSTEFASIIVEGTSSGNITYNRFVNYQAYQEWDIIGPPVLNQNMQSFAQTNTNNNTTSGAMAMGGDYYALGQYLTQWGSWVNYTTSTIPNANFPAAKGYQMGTNSIGSGNDMQGQTLAFTGEIATTTQTINIQNQNGANEGNGRRWNLVANPFSSYINGNTNAGTTNGGTNFIDVNANVLDLEYTGLYYWDADEDGWDVFNQLQTNSDDGTLFIAPGQGFFVAARNSEVAQISFTPQMRTILGGDDFISGAPILLNYKLDLKLFNGSAERAKTKFHFQQGLTLGLDAGYDAGAYNQAAALSSRLPEDDQGVNFQLNAMNLEAAYNQSIPLVINQEEGQNFRVSISNNTLPEDVYIYLEDVLNGTLTSLKDQDFELIAQSDLSDAGRFYIRFTTQNLAVNDVLSPSSLTVFKLNTDAFVTIQGLTPEMGKTTATIYNMLGMKVREKALDSSQSAQRISTQELASGVYIINLKAGDQAVSKKIIIQ